MPVGARWTHTYTELPVRGQLKRIDKKAPELWSAKMKLPQAISACPAAVQVNDLLSYPLCLFLASASSPTFLSGIQVDELRPTPIDIHRTSQWLEAQSFMARPMSRVSRPRSPSRPISCALLLHLEVSSLVTTQDGWEGEQRHALDHLTEANVLLSVSWE